MTIFHIITLLHSRSLAKAPHSHILIICSVLSLMLSLVLLSLLLSQFGRSPGMRQTLSLHPYVVRSHIASICTLFFFFFLLQLPMPSANSNVCLYLRTNLNVFANCFCFLVFFSRSVCLFYTQLSHSPNPTPPIPNTYRKRLLDSISPAYAWLRWQRIKLVRFNQLLWIVWRFDFNAFSSVVFLVIFVTNFNLILRIYCVFFLSIRSLSLSLLLFVFGNRYLRTLSRHRPYVCVRTNFIFIRLMWLHRE